MTTTDDDECSGEGGKDKGAGQALSRVVERWGVAVLSEGSWDSLVNAIVLIVEGDFQDKDGELWPHQDI